MIRLFGLTVGSSLLGVATYYAMTGRPIHAAVMVALGVLNTAWSLPKGGA